MKINKISFRGQRCFNQNWVGFDKIKPINVVIGRNNSGKSHVLDLVQVCCSQNFQKSGWQIKASSVLQQEDLRKRFNANTSGGDLDGNHWTNHGQRLVGQELDWNLNEDGKVIEARTTRSDLLNPKEKTPRYSAYLERLRQLLESAENDLSRMNFRRLFADRDVTPESPRRELFISSSGEGATDVIRKFITSSSPNYPREVIQSELLQALNQIFGKDGQFKEIQTQFHDHDNAGSPKGSWETYLGEESKGLIQLSRSGSGLKTVLLVLLNLLAIPKLEGKSKGSYVFAFEELENNLHPALLRRLYAYIENFALEHKCIFFLTTHSSVALDFFGLSESAQIFHVRHNGESAAMSTVQAHFEKMGIVAELGAKPSDLLQANGIVWVEGPSDRIYINHWIELFSSGKFQEGRDYQCAFYGGALLAKTEFSSPEEEKEHQNRVNLLRVNPNVYVVCDGDRSTPGGKIKERVRRIKGEVNKIPGAGFWATKGREIENYVPGHVIEKVIGLTKVPDPGQYEPFFPRLRVQESFLEAKCNRKTLDKTQFAVECVKYMDSENMSDRFDWSDKMKDIVKKIEEWNS